MKKAIVLIGASIVISISASSCKKDYRCECTKTYTSGTGSTTTNYSAFTYKDNLKRATDRCKANDDSGKDFFGNYSINCEIK
ncbi:MAG: hypothetical protein PSX36_04120 [bacterium]|nr:hypothetical protein [bacterium]